MEVWGEYLEKVGNGGNSLGMNGLEQISTGIGQIRQWDADVIEVGRSGAADAVECNYSDLEDDSLRHRRPAASVRRREEPV